MGYSVLHLAAELGYSHIVHTILNKIPALHKSDRYKLTTLGNTALHLAVSSGLTDCVAVLLQDNKADIDLTDPVSFLYLSESIETLYFRIDTFLSQIVR